MAWAALVVTVCASPSGCDALAPRPTGTRPPDGGAAVEPASLVAKWKVVAEERDGRRREIPPQANWTMDFLKGGKLTYCKRKCKDGTWMVKGDQLITTIETQTRTVTVKVAGDRLTATSGERASWRLHLERARAGQTPAK